MTGSPHAPAAAGSVILLDALAARLLLDADEARVWFLGRPLDWQCSLRRAGLLCPTCGLTRSAVLSLHGEWVRAWRVAPGGPVLTAALLAMAIALLCLAVLEGWGAEQPADRLRRSIQHGGLCLAAASIAIWIGGWAVRFAAVWPAG